MYPPRRQPYNPMNWKTLVIISVVVFFVLLVVPRVGFWPLMLFLWLGLPLLKNVLRTVGDYSTRQSKRRYGTRGAEAYDFPPTAYNGRPYHAPSAYEEFEDEKPKRRPEYVVGDDGELVEVEPEMKPKRGQSGSDVTI